MKQSTRFIEFVRAGARRILSERPAAPSGRGRKAPAATVAYLVGFTPPRQMPGQAPLPPYGRKALFGQYVKPYKGTGHLPPGRISKGARKRYDRDNDREGLRDFSVSINARR